MRKQDIFVLLLSAVALFFILQQEGTITLKKAFILPHNQPSHLSEAVEHELIEHDIVNMADLQTNEQFQDHGPKPVITDLDGDGYDEMITASRSDEGNTPIVRVLTFKHLAFRPGIIDDFSKLHVKKRLIFKAKSKHRIVGIATGKTSLKDKEQKIIIVFSNWKVLCFDHELKLLWETKITSDHDRNELQHYGAPKEVVALVSPYRVHKGDQGIVVIGLRQNNYKQHDHSQQSDQYEQASHYSYYAFNGDSGTQRWKHESTDFQFINEEDIDYPQHSYKVDARHHLQHSGEVHWRNYKEDIMRNLPHLFVHPHDNSMTTDHFVPSKRKDTSSTNSAEFGEVGEKISSALNQIRTSQSVSNANSIPNVVVSHLSKGIEVIHLYTGRTLCQVAPLRDLTAYGDLNGDGIIDSASIKSADGSSSPCLGMIESGSTTEVLFKVSICTQHSLLQKFSYGYFSDQVDTDIVQAAAPIIMKKVNPDGDMMNSVQFFVSTGLVTKVGYDKISGEWEIKWQSQTSSTWGINNRKSNKDGEIDRDKEVVDLSFAQLVPFALRKGEYPSFSIAVGDSIMSILDSSGTLQEEVNLPFSSVSPLILADINGDGVQDVIVTTNEGYYGFLTKTHSGSSVLSVLVVSMIGILALLFISTKIDIKDDMFQKNPLLKQQ